MSTELVRAPAGIVPADLNELERSMVMVERAFGAGAAQKVLIGHSAGLSLGQCLTDVHLMQVGGALKPTLSATAQLALARNAGVRTRWLERTDEAAALEITPPGQAPSVWRVTMEDARKAGWATGKNSGTWQAHPGAMLRARCITRAIRAECPEVLGGMSLYDPDELRSEPADTVSTATVVEPARPAIEQRKPPGVVIDAQPEAPTVEQRRASALAALCRHGITREHLESRVGAPVDAWDSVRLEQLKADYEALKRGAMSPTEYIALCAPPPDPEPAEDPGLSEADLDTWGETPLAPEPAPAKPPAGKKATSGVPV